ncbi:MAG: ribbon-helix-helix domain-containing protein [Vulcanisaeta sp.]|jgi:predicted DNA-binding protein|nr:ribbon-helix-helix domain-containing protein [Vulcanisaeta sp.]
MTKVMIPREMRDELKRLARERHVTVSELVQEAIEELLRGLRNGLARQSVNEEVVRRAVEEFVSQVGRVGVVERGDFEAFLKRWGITGRWARDLFRRELRSELARRGFRLVIIGGGDLVITRAKPQSQATR